MIKALVIFGCGLIFFAFIMIIAGSLLDLQPTPENEKFEVVDRYDNLCNVIRYTPDNSAKYHYFLDCKK